jgi:single-strand DNA-binding protein
MPRSANKVILVGNAGMLAKDPEVGYSRKRDSGREFQPRHKGSKTATTNGKSGPSGTTSPPGSVWRKSSANFVSKGCKLYVEGKIQTSSWGEKQSGEGKYRKESHARELLLLGPRENGADNHQNPTPNTNDDQRSHAGSDSVGMRIFRTPARSLPLLTEGRAVMSPANRHANDPANGSASTVQHFAVPASDTNIPTALTHNAAKTKELIANLEVPFHPSVIEARVTNSSKGGSPRGQVMPYADQRAYTDLLNALFTPAGWTRRPWQWPSQRQRCERPRRQPRSRDRADGTSAGETHASRVVEDPSESVES